MPIWIDPVTRQRVVYDKHSGDLVYDLDGDSAVSQETVPVIGEWKDWTGSSININANINTKQQMYGAGLSNELQGTDIQIENLAKVGALGVVGQNTQTTRRRTIKRRVHFKDGKGIAI